MSPARIIGRSIESMIADMVSAGWEVTFVPEPGGKTFTMRVGRSRVGGVVAHGVALNETGHRLDSLEIDRCVSSAWRILSDPDGYPPREDRT